MFGAPRAAGKPTRQIAEDAEIVVDDGFPRNLGTFLVFQRRVKNRGALREIAQRQILKLGNRFERRFEAVHDEDFLVAEVPQRGFLDDQIHRDWNFGVIAQQFAVEDIGGQCAEVRRAHRFAKHHRIATAQRFECAGLRQIERLPHVERIEPSLAEIGPNFSGAENPRLTQGIGLARDDRESGHIDCVAGDRGAGIKPQRKFVH